MYYRINQVLEQYPFVVDSTHKGRGALICETDRGKISIKEYQGSEARADFLHQLLYFLKEKGQIFVDSIVLTKEESSLAKEGEDLSFLARDFHEGRECDTKSREDLLHAMEELAALHNITDEFPGEIPEFIKTKPDTLLLEYRKHSREMKKVRNYIVAKKKKNDFELEYMKNYSSFLSQADEVTRLQEKEPEQERMYGICHGDFNQHNILFSRAGTIILNFERSFYGLQVHDVSNFMRKILEKHNWNLNLGMDLLRAYCSVRPLKEEEIHQLNIRLAYPEKFWKISNRYYNTSKAWVCGGHLDKLAKLIEQNEARLRFLSAINWNKILF